MRNVFLSGDRLLVFGGRDDQEFEPGLRSPGAQAVLTLYDVADLRDPRPVATLTLDGDVLDARLVGTQVRVATVASPDVDASSPDVHPRRPDLGGSKAELRAAIGGDDGRRLDPGVHPP